MSMATKTLGTATLGLALMAGVVAMRTPKTGLENAKENPTEIKWDDKKSYVDNTIENAKVAGGKVVDFADKTTDNKNTIPLGAAAALAGLGFVGAKGIERKKAEKEAKVDKDLAATVEYRNRLKESILPKIPENLREEASKLIETKAEAKNIYGTVIGHYNKTATNFGDTYGRYPELGVKLDLLEAHGIKTFVSVIEDTFISSMYITENGVTHEFDYKHLDDGYKWIDTKLAEFAK